MRDALLERVHIENTGDDSFALWGADLYPENVTFSQVTAVNPGVMRPGWYGNCVATYGLRSVVFDRVDCQEPTLAHPIPQPYGARDYTMNDNSMFVFYTSFGGEYPGERRGTFHSLGVRRASHIRQSPDQFLSPAVSA